MGSEGYVLFLCSYTPVEFVDLAHQQKEFLQNNRKIEGVIVQTHGNIFILILTKNYCLFWGLR